MPTGSVGVVVPCKNEIDSLAACLGSIRSQVPAVDRIVVVDNGSTDGSLEVARRLADQVLERPSGSIAGMRNAGAARCDDLSVLVFVDADCELLPGWLETALDALETADLVGTRSLAAPDAPWVARRWAAIEAHQQHAGSLAWTQQFAVRTRSFVAIGGFDESLVTGEDGDLCMRIRSHGGTVHLVGDMKAIHHGFPGTLSAFWRRERWHTSQRGWFPTMSAKSRLLVLLAGGWLVSSGVALAAAAVGDPLPFTVVAAGSVAAVVGVGTVAASSPRHALADGTLLWMWAVGRALRLPRGLGSR